MSERNFRESEHHEQEPAPVSVLLHMEYEQALARERAMLAAAGSDASLAWMLWQTDPCIVVPRSHESRSDFEAAVAASAGRGWRVHTRDTGGGAVVQGAGVVNLSMVFSIGAALRERIGTGYRVLCEPLMAMLRGRGMEGSYRAVSGTMCDGAYNVVVGARKLAGTAQRWRSHGRDRPGAHAVLAHMAVFADLDHGVAAAAINALYADMDIDAGIEASRHVNWSEIATPAADCDMAGLLARELDDACRMVRLEEMLEQALHAQRAK